MESKKGLITQLGETWDRYRLEKEVSKEHKSLNGQENKFRQLLFWFIPNGGTILLIAVLIATQSVWAQNHTTSLSSSTTTISYQGRLLDGSGLPVNDPGLGITFRLYDTDIEGSPLWAEDHIGVPVQDGLFHVLLGSMNPIPISLLADTGTLWLGVQVGNDSEMLPREQIASVPYAILASTVLNGGITTEKLADQAVTQAKLGPDVNLLPPPGSITTTMIADEAVTGSKLAFNALDNAGLPQANLIANVQSAYSDVEIPLISPDWKDLLSIPLDLPEAATLRITYQAMVWKTVYAGRTMVGIRIDGEPDTGSEGPHMSQAGTPVSPLWTADSYALSSTYFVNVPAGQHTVTLVLGSHDGGTSHVDKYGMNVEVLRQP